ncbi:MAG: hypothetical protein AB7H88_06560 [Vicinamibacterales bacterium]
MPPPNRLNLRLTWLLGLGLAAAATLGPAVAARQPAGPAIPLRWEGTATVEFSFTPAVPFGAADWDGAFLDHRDLRIRAGEARRADVHDAAGRLTGEFVWLEDDGTTWEGQVSDGESHLGGAVQMLAAGSGRGTAMVFGLVYHALVDDDPLAPTLADGSYCLQASLIPSLRYTLTIREEHRRDEVTAEESTGQFVAGDCSLLMRVARLGGGLTVDRVAAAVRAPLDPSQRFLVEGRRALADGVMTGSSRRELEAGSGSVVAVNWNVHRRLRLNGHIDRVDAGWRPKLAQDVTIGASVDEALGVAGKFRFTLYDVSREKGYALNAGGDGTGLDLRFHTDQPTAFAAPVQTADGWTIETTSTATSAAVRVFAMDYGAWGRLKAEVNVDGEWYECLDEDGRAYVTVPLDVNENRIWDTWERNTGIWDRPASADADPGADGTPAGDGFSNYEEYRGFMVDGNWVSLDPGTRELFVLDTIGRGTGAFGASGIITFVVDQGELDEDRVANYNRGYASAGQQRGLKLVDASLAEGTLGRVWPNVGTPNTVTRVDLDTAQIDGHPSEAWDSTVAHEMGHAVGVQHHGDWRIAGCNGGPPGLTALWGGAHAGDQGCVMTYSGATYYQGWDRHCYPYTWPDTWGTTFCQSRTGTGINAGERRMEDGRPLPVSGDGRHGDCLHAVRLK